MDREYYNALTKVRLERSEELIEESRDLLVKGAYKSANNRSFYAIEKSVKALLATEQMDVTTHNGGLKQFNYLFIFKGDGTFTASDYQIIANAEQIRNASDYDDFYIASKAEAKQQVENAEYLVKKIKKYLADKID
ncbi:MAG: HEPN domain-containing protein [Eubacteriales bacterium]|nr:HEPN domain-containing protein [Eubacteriales bacterium]